MHISTGPVQVGGSGQILVPELGKPVLFFDDSALSDTEAIERIWHLPEKRGEPVMTATKPWEKFGKYQCVGGFSGKCFVVKDGKIMMFYSIYHMGPGPEFRSFAYAESKDGIHWVKPDLGDGTNLLIRNKARGKDIGPAYPYWEMQNVLWDEHSQRYLCMGHCAVSAKKSGTFYGWSKIPTKWDTANFTIPYRNDDIHALLGWNGKEYISYPRVLVLRGGKYRRAIGYSTSKDFKKWSDPMPVLWPLAFDEYNYEIYNMPVEQIGQYYLSLPIAYRSSPNGHGPLDTELAFSTTGADFLRPLGHVPYISRGLPGDWDDSYVMAASPINFKDQTLFYYWGCNFPHDAGFREEDRDYGFVGLATLPKDRYCGLGCPRQMRGVVTTRLISSNAKKVEYDGDGKIVLDVLDRDGHPTSPGKGPFRLRFELSDAELFSFTLT